MEFLNGILGIAGAVALVVVALIATVFFFVRYDKPSK